MFIACIMHTSSRENVFYKRLLRFFTHVFPTIFNRFIHSHTQTYTNTSKPHLCERFCCLRYIQHDNKILLIIATDEKYPKQFSSMFFFSFFFIPHIKDRKQENQIFMQTQSIVQFNRNTSIIFTTTHKQIQYV